MNRWISQAFAYLCTSLEKNQPAKFAAQFSERLKLDGCGIAGQSVSAGHQVLQKRAVLFERSNSERRASSSVESAANL